MNNASFSQVQSTTEANLIESHTILTGVVLGGVDRDVA